MAHEQDRREALLQADSIQGPGAEAYIRAMEALLHRKFNPWTRTLYILGTVGGATMAVALSSLALTEPPTTPTSTRYILGVLVLLGTFWCWVCGSALWRGRIGLLEDRRHAAWGALAASLLQTLVFAFRAANTDGEPTTTNTLSGLLVSLTFVILASLLVALQSIRESELRNLEHHWITPGSPS